MKKFITTILCVFAVFVINAQSVNNLYGSPTGWDADDNSKEGSWLHYDNGTFEVPAGLTFDGVNFESFKWGIMFPATDISAYAGQSITKVSIYDCEAFDGEVFIYEGGSSEPGTLLYSQEFSTTGSQDYMEIELNTAVEVNGNQSVWVVITNYNGKQPAAGCADQGKANGRWIYYEGYGWMDFAMLSMPAYTWQVRAYVEEQNQESVEENEIDNVKIYPNPTSSNLNIDIDSMTNISIFNSLGQLVYDSKVESDNFVIDMSQFDAGVYMIRVTTENGLITKRVSIAK